ncbi:MAG: acyl-CoA dehydrogenase family protein [Bdellovibrionales bacterium]|nr:acyl-CoA dehydrogenase family protein [Bdellovibrionales bacterium]
MLEFVSQRDPFELRELASTARKFAEARLGTVGFQREHFNDMGELGLAGMCLDEAVGGSSFDSLSIAATIFEIARVQLGPAIYLSVHQMVSKLIQNYWEAPDKQSLLSELAAGTKLGAYCLTEASAGSDASSLKTTARQESSGDWLLNGEKIYITSAGLADVYLVFARTSDSARSSITAFLVTKESRGIEFGPAERKMGAEGSPIGSVLLRDCRVPADRVVGGVGEGYRIALSGLNGGRINIAAAACGLSSAAITLARSHLSERSQFGSPLKDFQGLQFMIAEMAMKLRAAVLVTRDAAGELDRAPTVNWPASIAKCFASDRAMEITTDAVQLFGGAGYLADYKVEQLMRDAKMLQIVEGTNQIQRVLIARSLFG